MTPFSRCLVKCLEKDLPVHYLVIGRGSATVDLERNAGVRFIPVLPSLVQCLGRGLLELGVLLPIALIVCQGWLLCLECKIPPWFASLAAALLGFVGVSCLSAGGDLALMPFLSSLLPLAVCLRSVAVEHDVLLDREDG